MTALMPERRYTPSDLECLSGAGLCELIDGRLVEKNGGAEASWIACQVATRLYNHPETKQAAWILGSKAGYHCFPFDTSRVRKPDVSVVSRARLPRVPRGHIHIAPDLAVEVVAPNDRRSEVEQKVNDYVLARVPLIWVVAPSSRSVTVYADRGRVEQLGTWDTLTGGEVLPGFGCAVGELFPPIEMTEVSEDRE
ncbi:MAG: hypothetical protein K0Q72_5268 [Armatimonadetes bacterium]|jgi:Uma2 family endonuclease|nr:hypothetical protein [Armatimonadota bacterium]